MKNLLKSMFTIRIVMQLEQLGQLQSTAVRGYAPHLDRDNDGIACE